MNRQVFLIEIDLEVSLGGGVGKCAELPWIVSARLLLFH